MLEDTFVTATDVTNVVVVAEVACVVKPAVVAVVVVDVLVFVANKRNQNISTIR